MTNNVTGEAQDPRPIELEQGTSQVDGSPDPKSEPIDELVGVGPSNATAEDLDQPTAAETVGEPQSGDDPASEERPRRRRWPLVLWGLASISLVLYGLGIWWSFQPPKFDVTANATALAGEGADARGVATVATAIQLAQTLLNKPGGYVTNDITPPGLLMDNMSHWEYGVLNELRDSVRSMRNDFSRSLTQSLENEDLKNADAQLNFDSDAWLLPSTEDAYRGAVDALHSYLDALASGQDRSARFYIRADNLSAYLAVVEKRLGSYSQRLSASVGDTMLTAALTYDEAEADATPERTPWNEVDDVFFEVRGYAWALVHMLSAVAIDFEDVLEDKNAMVSIKQIIRDLDRATNRQWSPIVLNGRGFGVLANHSLVLASYISRVNAAVIDLRDLLQRG